VNGHDDIDDKLGDDALPPALMHELMSGLRPLPPPPERAAALRARVMGSLREAAQEDSELSLAIAALRSLTPLADARWEERWPGIELCMLRVADDSRSYLMRMQPGSRLPAHVHSRDEVSMIIEGEALVGGTQRMGPGDFQFMPAGVDHAVIDSPAGCIAFIHGERSFRPRLTAGFVARFIHYTVQRWSR